MARERRIATEREIATHFYAASCGDCEVSFRRFAGKMGGKTVEQSDPITQAR